MATSENPLQQVEPALAQRLDRVVQRRIPAGTARSLAWAALGDLERLVEGEGVVGDVLELVEPRRIGGPDGQRAPLEVEAGIGEDLGADDVGSGLPELRARGDEVRRSRPQQLDELQISRGAGKVE